MSSPLKFPTPLHQDLAELAADFFSAHKQVDTILVVNSCARGHAVAGSDLDVAVLIKPESASQEVQSLTALWEKFIATHPLLHRFRSTGKLTQVHLDVFDGRMVQPFGMTVAARTALRWRSAIASCMRPRSTRQGLIFDSFSPNGCPYYGEDLRLTRLAWCARRAPGI
jgi:predicted nucleotidyltransferase